MEHVTARPGLPELKSSIGSYSQIIGKGALSKTIPPGTGAVLLVNLKGRYRVNGATVPDTTLVGIRENPWELERDDSATDRIFVQFSPSGLSRFTGIPANSIANRILPAEEVLPDDLLRHLVRQLSEARAFDDRRAMLDRFFMDLYSPPKHLEEDIEMMAYRLSIYSAASLSSLLEAIPASPRHTERLFARLVGLSPQTFARITRFERARNKMLESDFRSLADIGLEAGYYDQAHFTREFKRLSRSTPGSYNYCSSVRVESPLGTH
jgi:AraC-like DNA-binding protein